MDPLIRMMGPLRLDTDSNDKIPTAPKTRTLFSLLAVRAGQFVSVERLVHEIWGTEPPSSYMTTLQTYLSMLRRYAPSLVINTRPKGYVLAIEPGNVDIHRFIGGVIQAQKSMAKGAFTAAWEALEAVLPLINGSACVDVECGSELSQWAEKVADYQRTATVCHYELAVRLDFYPEVLNELRTEWRSNPRREDIARLLMIALNHLLLREEAIDVYRTTVAALSDDLGIDPSSRLHGLFQKILEGEDVEL